MDETQFNEKYFFDHLKMVTVVNPQPEDFTFGITLDTSVDMATGQMKSEKRYYTVPAGGRERLPGVVANLYLDQMTKLIAQQEETIHLIPDFFERSKYYDDLIVSIDDMLSASTVEVPAYQSKQEKSTPVVKDDPFKGLEDANATRQTGNEDRKMETGVKAGVKTGAKAGTGRVGGKTE